MVWEKGKKTILWDIYFIAFIFGHVFLLFMVLCPSGDLPLMAPPTPLCWPHPSLDVI